MTLGKNNSEISMREQMKRFAITSMRGFQSVLVFGIGRRLEIFKYLYEKAKSEKIEGNITSISFTIEELSEKLNLDMKYLDAWLHMALECGIFEVDTSIKRGAKTALHIYDLLIDRDHKSYIGGTISSFYRMALYQDILIEGFKTGQVRGLFDIPTKPYMERQQASSRFGSLIEKLFAKYCKEDRKKLLTDANVLEVGCGFGFNLEIWAKEYKKAKFIGIDIDPNGVEHAKELVNQYNWNNRIEILEISLEKYLQLTDMKFDFIILNQVLHEMDPNEDYRISVLKNIYTLLKDDGLLILGESIIPDTFARKKEFQLYDIMHKWVEVGFGSLFYDEPGLRRLINSTPFKNIKLIKERGSYFWAVRKQ